eukprot:1157532-Pelagomonas_calceolata.AAC.4
MGCHCWALHRRPPPRTHARAAGQIRGSWAWGREHVQPMRQPAEEMVRNQFGNATGEMLGQEHVQQMRQLFSHSLQLSRPSYVSHRAASVAAQH